MLKQLRRFAENPRVNFLSGLVLLITAGNEVYDSLVGDFHLGAHHGVALFGLLQMLKYLPEVVHGAEQVSRIEPE